MIIGTTKLKSIDFGEHEGIYITEIKNRQEAFKIRLHLNRIMQIGDILGHVIINDNSDEFETCIDIMVYGIRDPNDFKYCQENANQFGYQIGDIINFLKGYTIQHLGPNVLCQKNG